MTIEQYGDIFRLIHEAKISALVKHDQAEYDWQRTDAMKTLTLVEAAGKALHDAWMHSGILRGQAPCPECGEYFDVFEQKEAA